jgi:hypothetical protein
MAKRLYLRGLRVQPVQLSMPNETALLPGGRAPPLARHAMDSDRRRREDARVISVVWNVTRITSRLLNLPYARNIKSPSGVTARIRQ